MGKLGALLLLAAIPADPQALIQGLVETVEEGERTPVAEAAVRAFVDDEAIAVARSGRDGLYAIEVPAESFELRLDKPGYVVARAGGLAQPRLHRGCPASGDCGAVDFVLERAAAVEIWLSDPAGDPFPEVRVALTSGSVREPVAVEELTNDRGAARFHDLAAGPYRIDIHTPVPHPMVGRLYEADPLEIELRPGEERKVYAAARRVGAESVSLSGVIEGVDFQVMRSPWLVIRPVGEGSSGQGWSFWQREAEVRAPRLPKGEYVLMLADRSREPAAEPVLLGRVRLDKDLSGVVLQPMKPPTLLVHAVFEEGAPEEAGFTLRSSEGWDWRTYRVRRGSVNVTIRDAPPGRYTLEAASDDSFLLEEPAVHLSEGSIESLRVTVSARFGRVQGRVRGAGDGAVRVELEGPRGSASMSTGPGGVFAFERLRPGDHILCASAPDSPCAADSKLRLSIEPGDEVELDLRAPQ